MFFKYSKLDTAIRNLQRNLSVFTVLKQEPFHDAYNFFVRNEARKAIFVARNKHDKELYAKFEANTPSSRVKVFTEDRPVGYSIVESKMLLSMLLDVIKFLTIRMRRGRCRRPSVI